VIIVVLSASACSAGVVHSSSSATAA
jgi:hypothetical protein